MASWKTKEEEKAWVEAMVAHCESLGWQKPKPRDEKQISLAPLPTNTDKR